MITEKEKNNMDQFYKALVSLENVDEAKAFLEDVSTIKELIEMSSRLEVARMLDEGKVFNEISRETGASSATISRVNKCLSYGANGYRIVLDRLKK